jgi:hypothetical protein
VKIITQLSSDEIKNGEARPLPTTGLHTVVIIHYLIKHRDNFTTANFNSIDTELNLHFSCKGRGV